MKWVHRFGTLFRDFLDLGAQKRTKDMELKGYTAAIVFFLSTTVSVLGNVDTLTNLFLYKVPYVTITVILFAYLTAGLIALGFITSKTSSSGSVRFSSTPLRLSYRYAQVYRQLAKLVLVGVLIGLPIHIRASIFWFIQPPMLLQGFVVAKGSLTPVNGARLYIRSASGEDRTAGSLWLSDDGGAWLMRTASVPARSDALVVVPDGGEPVSVPLVVIRKQLTCHEPIILTVAIP